MLRCGALLLDLDGTLIDSDRASEDIWRRWAAERAVDVAKILAIHHGRRPQETIRAVAPHLDADAEANAIQTENAGSIEGVAAYPGAAELLALLPLERHAVVTSARRRVAVNRLTALGIWREPLLVGAEDVAQGKPHPEGYLRAAHLLGVAPERCAVIEDAPAGVEAARAAGMKVIGVLSTHDPGRLPADRHIQGLGALVVAVEGDELVLRFRR